MTTETQTLSVEEVRALLVRAIEEKGADYVYASPMEEGEHEGECVYRTPDGAPSCIAGHVAAYMGVLGELREGYTVSGQDILATKLDYAAAWALGVAQDAQDRGKSWGEALVAFDKEAASMMGDQK